MTERDPRFPRDIREFWRVIEWPRQNHMDREWLEAVGLAPELPARGAHICEDAFMGHIRERFPDLPKPFGGGIAGVGLPSSWPAPSCSLYWSSPSHGRSLEVIFWGPVIEWFTWTGHVVSELVWDTPGRKDLDKTRIRFGQQWFDSDEPAVHPGLIDALRWIGGGSMDWDLDWDGMSEPRGDGGR